jgi:hypothetical protein
MTTHHLKRRRVYRRQPDRPKKTSSPHRTFNDLNKETLLMGKVLDFPRYVILNDWIYAFCIKRTGSGNSGSGDSGIYQLKPYFGDIPEFGCCLGAA